MVFPRSKARALSLWIMGLTICSVFLSLAVGIPQAPKASADPLGSAITVVLDTFTPVVPVRGETLRISGRLVNTSSEVIEGVSVRLGVSASPLTKRSAITSISALELNPEAEPIDYFLNRTRVDVTESMAPGEEKTFALSEPFVSLPLGKDGVYPLMVEVLGKQKGVDVSSQRQGGLRTFIPWMSSGTDKISLVWLWPLMSAPATQANGVLLNENTPRALMPGGRLESLLTLGAENPAKVSWIIDPALLQSAQEIASGYQVRSGDTVSVGDLSQGAQDWLGRVSDVLIASSTQNESDRVPARVVPYANIDASALQRADMNVDLVRATTMAPVMAGSILGNPVTGTVYWAPDGRLSKRTGDVLASSGMRTVILSSRALPPTNPDVESFGMGVLGTTFGGMNAVLIDSGLSDTLAIKQDSRSQGILMRQRFLSETAIMSQLLPENAQSNYVVAAPRDVYWNPSPEALGDLLGATGTAPWLSRATLSELLKQGATSTIRERGGYGEKAKASELSEDYLNQVKQASIQLAALTDVLDNPTGFTDTYAEAILRTESEAWRDDPETGAELLASIRTGLRQEINKVYALSEGTITLSGENGLVPVTIANDLDRSVTVGVQLRGYPSARLVSEPMYGITIDPGKKVSVELEVDIVGGQTLPAGVQLLTPGGETFGSPARIELVSTAYARAAAWVIAAAFIAIVIFVVVGITRRIHKATQSNAQSQEKPEKRGGSEDV
ncbi:MAG: DUF6049 family protein [Candidatus Nanopelagicales bacterium]|jgi:hypothetical protein